MQKLRKWQDAFLSDILCKMKEGKQLYLLVATMGAGKTTAASVLTKITLARTKINRVVVLCPTDSLRTQWSKSMLTWGIQINSNLCNGDKLTSDFHGVSATYQQIHANPFFWKKLISDRNTILILDEIHHLSDESSWGVEVNELISASSYHLALSGTIFRTGDRVPIAGVTYENEVVKPDYMYGYSEALRDGVVRPIKFSFVNVTGQASRYKNGSVDRKRKVSMATAPNNEVADKLLSQGLEDSEWVDRVLDESIQYLEEVRLDAPSAGGLVTCKNQNHAEWITGLLEERGYDVTLVISKIKGARKRIDEFREGKGDWIVAVGMVSEGVDIPRLRVGTYLSPCKTTLIMRQWVGRMIRVNGEDNAPSFCIVPEHPKIVQIAYELKSEKLHSLKKYVQVEVERGDEPRVYPKWVIDVIDSVVSIPSSTPIEVLRSGHSYTSPDGNEVVSNDETIIVVRKKLSRLVSAVHQKTGDSHRQIWSMLKKRASGKSVRECSLQQIKMHIRFLQKRYGL